MGLDLILEGSAKAGHEAEWLQLLERSFSSSSTPGGDLSDAEFARFDEISIPAYTRIGAPRVGTDAAADAWIIEAKRAQTPEDVAQILREFDGYYVLRLCECDGIPAYSNAGFYEGIDETSFRGAFLEDCRDVISQPLLEAAWENKLPEAAIDYGKALLAAANAAEGPSAPVRKGLLSRFNLRKSPDRLPLPEQLDIVRAAGRWFIFWGERGHPVRAYF